MTKTEQKLITMAKENGGVGSIEYGRGRGPKGGRIQYGIRELAALNNLKKRGIVRVTAKNSSPFYNRGNLVWSTLLTFEIV